MNVCRLTASEEASGVVFCLLCLSRLYALDQEDPGG
jgi:hypothetical protein